MNNTFWVGIQPALSEEELSYVSKKNFNFLNHESFRFCIKYLKKKIKNVFLVTGGGMMFMVNALSKSKIKYTS
jgi:hypothetical protein